MILLSVIIWDGCTNNLDKLLIVDHAVWFNVSFTEDLIHLSSAQFLPPLDKNVPQVFCRYNSSFLRTHSSKSFEQLLGDGLLLGVAVHYVQEVGKGDLAALVLHVGLELGDGGGHAETPHDHRQLVHGPDVP